MLAINIFTLLYWIQDPREGGRRTRTAQLIAQPSGEPDWLRFKSPNINANRSCRERRLLHTNDVQSLACRVQIRTNLSPNRTGDATERIIPCAATRMAI